MLRRALLVLGLAVSVATCRDAFAPGRGPVRAGRIALAPILPSAAALADFGLTIDGVRFVVVRPAADTLADTTVALPPDATELALDLRVPLLSSPETLSVSVLALDGQIPLFVGTRLVSVPTRLPPPEIAVDTYVGPVAESIVIQPRSPFILLNDSLRFQVQGFNGGVPVTQFYVAWSTSDTTIARINGFGVLRAPAGRTALRVRARTPSGAADSVTVTFTPPATQLVAIAGGGQIDTVGKALATPLEVQARAADGLGVGGITVRFRRLNGGGTVTDSVVVTDGAGRASTTVTLGGVLGGQTFEASAAGLSGSPVAFSATALAGPPALLVVVAGDGQLAPVATALATRPAVQIKDAGGNAVAGVGVTFTVGSGGGGITGGTQTTDATGTATVGSWTLGTAAGTNTLTASAGGLTRTFTANGVAGAATQLVRTAGNLQSALVGTLVATAPAVRAQDQYANPVAGAPITFAVSVGGGSVTGATQLTNAAGIATVGSWALDTLVTTNALTATAGALSAVFTATGLPGAPTRLVKVLGDSQTAVVNTALALTPTVRLTDRYGNAIAGDTIDFFVLVDGGFVANPDSATDAAGVASAGAWTLANFVAQNVLQAAVRGVVVPIVRFTATGTPDAPVQLLRVSIDTQTALAGQAVSVPPAVQVTDQYFNPVPGASVTFTLTPPLLGSLTPTSATTDSTGVARVTAWTLALIAGLNALDASASGLAGSPITFSANGITTTATSMALNAGDLQSGIVATVLTAPYEVHVLDISGAPVQNVQVHWAAGPAGGSMNPPTSLTDVNGIASSTRTLGLTAGTQTATASVAGLTGSPVTFTATAVADVPAQLVKQSADPQTATVATAVTAPVVRVADQFGNGVGGVIVDFALTQGGGIVGAAQDTSDALGLASAGSWTLGSLVGTNSIAATAGVLPGVTFTATSFAGPPARLAFLTEPGRALAGDTIEPVLQLVIQDQFGNTALPAKDVVSLQLGAAPQPAAKLVGIVDAAAVNGVATFASLAIDSAGVGYTLVATAVNLTDAESKPFDIGGVIGAIPVTRGPVAAALNTGTKKIYVPGASLVSVLLDDRELLPQIPGFESSFGVAANATTNQIYVSTLAGLVVIDGSRTPDVIRLTIPVGTGAKGLAVDEQANFIYVAASDPLKGGPALVPVDGSKDAVVLGDVVGLPAAGVGVAFNPNDGFVYVAIPTLQEVVVIDPKPGGARIVAEIRNLGKVTYGVAVDVRTNVLYVTNSGDNNVSVINLVDFKEIARLPVGRSPEGLGVDPDRGVVYVGNSGENTVSLIDGAKGNVFATLVVGPAPKAAVLDPVTGRVYVATQLDDRVRVIQP